MNVRLINQNLPKVVPKTDPGETALKNFMNQERKCQSVDFTNHGDVVNCIALNSAENFIASASFDKTVKVFSFSAQELKSYTCSGKVFCVSYSSDDRFLFAGSENKIYIWNQEIDQQNEIIVPVQNVQCIRMSKDFKRLIFGSNDSKVRILDIDSKQITTEFLKHTNQVTSVGFLNDETLAFSSSFDKTIKLWSSLTGQEIHSFNNHTLDIMCTILSSDGKYLLSGSNDKLIKVFDVHKRAEEFTLKGHEYRVICLAINKENTHIVSGSADKSIKIWNFKERREEFSINAHNHWVMSVVITKDISWVISSSQDKTVKMWNFRDNSRLKSIKAHENRINSLDISPDGQLILSASWDGTYKIWNFLTENEVYAYKGHQENKGQVNCAIFSPNGKYIASGGLDKKVVLLEFSSKQERVATNHTEKVNCLAFTPDSNWLISGANDHNIILWDTANFREKFIFIGHKSYVLSLTFDHKGETFASGSQDKSIKVWSRINEKLLYSLSGHEGDVNSVAFSNDDAQLVSGCGDKTIKLWNLLQKREEYSFEGHESYVTSVALSKDSSLIFSSSWDKSIKVWNINERREEYSLYGHADLIKSVKIMNDDLFAVSAGGDKSIMIWNLSRTDFINILSLRPPRIINYYNIYMSLNDAYDQIAPSNINHLYTEHCFSILHLASMKRNFNTVQRILVKGAHLTSDAYGHSPIYYTLLNQDQLSTDIFIEYIVRMSGNKSKLLIFLSNIHAIRNDFPALLRNSSAKIQDLINSLIYADSELSKFGVPKSSLPMILYQPTKKPCESDFIDTESTDISQKKSVNLRVSSLSVPTTMGSISSLSLLKSIKECRNLEIFNSFFIKYYIRYKWNQAIWITRSITLLQMLNIVLIVLLLVNGPNAVESMILLFINVPLVLWEFLQIFSEGCYYFNDPWNYIDIFRILLTIVWQCLEYTDTTKKELTCVMILFTVFKGLTGFQAFDGTRYYIALIFRALNDIKFFIVMLIYLTFSFGILFAVINNQKILTFKTIWIDSYDLNLGSFNSEEGINITYLIFFFATIINVILMLNLLISILGDTYDNFQVNQNIFGCKEMLNFLIQCEQIFFWNRKDDIYKYMHICEPQLNDKQVSLWDGKIIYLTSKIDNLEENLEKQRYLSLELKDLINESMKTTYNNFKALIFKLDELKMQAKTSFN